MNDRDYLENVTSVLNTEIAFILRLSESSVRITLDIGNETTKRQSDFATKISVDLEGNFITMIQTHPKIGAYPPNYLVIIVAVAVGVPCGLFAVVAFYMFWYRMKLQALTKDCMLELTSVG